jgi:hypothetical protein
MNSKKSNIILIISVVLFLHYIPVFGWSHKGHEVITNIAEAHLSIKAKKEVRKLLNGRTMVYYATWMDDIRNDPAYAYTRTWHYANVDKGKTYETMERQEGGDVVTATVLSIKQLKNKNLPGSVRAMYLKFLLHLVGDMHCPMHAGRATDRGGNDYPVVWKNTRTNLHRLWDDMVIEASKDWSSIEWATYIDIDMDKKQQQAIEAGSPLDWFKETVVQASNIYDNTPENQTVPSNYVRKYTPLIEEQFLKAGYRLAGLLNSIFK